jgi:hypothetical protein
MKTTAAATRTRLKPARPQAPTPPPQLRQPMTPDQMAALDVLLAAAKPGLELAVGPAGTEVQLTARLKRAKRYGYGAPTAILFLDALPALDGLTRTEFRVLLRVLARAPFGDNIAPISAAAIAREIGLDRSHVAAAIRSLARADPDRGRGGQGHAAAVLPDHDPPSLARQRLRLPRRAGGAFAACHPGSPRGARRLRRLAVTPTAQWLRRQAEAPAPGLDRLRLSEPVEEIAQTSPPVADEGPPHGARRVEREAPRPAPESIHHGAREGDAAGARADGGQGTAHALDPLRGWVVAGVRYRVDELVRRHRGLLSPPN